MRNARAKRASLGQRLPLYKHNSVSPDRVFVDVARFMTILMFRSNSTIRYDAGDAPHTRTCAHIPGVFVVEAK